MSLPLATPGRHVEVVTQEVELNIYYTVVLSSSPQASKKDKLECHDRQGYNARYEGPHNAGEDVTFNMTRLRFMEVKHARDVVLCRV